MDTSNLQAHPASITYKDRTSRSGHKALVIWFTGLSGSGKSTIANALEVELYKLGLRTYLLDGDNTRLGLNKDLGFSESDRAENIRRVSEVSKILMDAGVIVLTAFISPHLIDRMKARETIGTENFVEVYLSTPIDICEKRDVKGLYKKARNGELKNMTGIDSPYEVPTNSEIKIDASVTSIDEITSQLVSYITNKLNYLL